MRKLRKKYSGPAHPWQLKRIEEEVKLTREYGLANKKEIWRMASLIRNWRAQARKIVGMLEGREEAETALISKLQRLGVLGKEADIDDVLDLGLRDVAEKRLQTVVFRQGLANTPKQARQFIVHNKLTINDKCIAAPSYLVKIDDKISFVSGFKPQIVPKKVKKREVKEENG